jgi:hypothetical protein
MSGCLKCGSKEWTKICSGIKAQYKTECMIVGVFKCNKCESISPRVETPGSFYEAMSKR